MKKPTVKTYLMCPECGEVVSIWRVIGRQHKEGHIKTLYCWKCKKETQQEEVKDRSLMSIEVDW